MKQVHTICGMCGNLTCGLTVQTDGKTLTRVRGDKLSPGNQGRLCPQAKAALELQHSPLRIDSPLKKSKAGWHSITWDQALDEISDKFLEFREKYGAQSLALYQGHSLLTLMRQGWSQRFLNLIGSPNLIRNEHMCHMPTAMVERCTYGSSLVWGFDPKRVGCLVLWGNNPFTSSQPIFWSWVNKAVKNGAPLVVIDPRKDRHTGKAKLHLAPLPGTDGALALGIIREMIAQKVYDTEFVKNKTSGFEKLKQQVEPYTLAWSSKHTGVTPESIRELVRILTANKPLHLATGNALEHHSNAFQCLRAIAVLRALSGGIGTPGGHWLSMPGILPDMSLPAPRKPASQAPKPLGSEKYPLFTKMLGFVPGDSFIDSLLTAEPYAVTGALMMGGNPLLTWPHTKKVKKAFGSIKFMVAADILHTQTTEMADIILPAAAFWEKDMLFERQILGKNGLPEHNILMMRAVLQPGQRRSDRWILSELARKMGFGANYSPWYDDLAAINAQLESLDLGHEDLPPQGMLLKGDPEAYNPERFDTPSGRIELFSQLAEQSGYQSLPEYVPPKESAINTPELVRQYPLILNAGGHHIEYTHSQFRHIDSLKRLRPEPEAEIHPDTALENKIKNEDNILVETLRGRIILKARVTAEIIAGVVHIKHGWPQANVNYLTEYRHTDPALATVALRSGLCKISQAPVSE